MVFRESACCIQRSARRGHLRLWPGRKLFGTVSAGEAVPEPSAAQTPIPVNTNTPHALVLTVCRVSALLRLASCLTPSWTPIFLLFGIPRIVDGTEASQPGPTGLEFWFATLGTESAGCAIGSGIIIPQTVFVAIERPPLGSGFAGSGGQRE